jgi:hypothetical protein
MADAENFDPSIGNSLAAQNENQTSKAAEDQKEAQSKGAQGAAKAVAAAKQRLASPDAQKSPAAPVTNGQVPGGNSMVSVDSPKGQALTADPKANLAAKGRFSDYRKVFSARGLAGKHSWGSK